MHSPPRMVPLVAALAALSFAAPAVVAAQDKVPAPVTSTSADNTEVNARDKAHDTLTPLDQSNDSEDVKVAAAVRQSITKDDSLSMMAHNVKLIASAGVVTLRGPVASEVEKAKVGKLAAAAPGVSSVNNELDIKQ